MLPKSKNNYFVVTCVAKIVRFTFLHLRQWSSEAVELIDNSLGPESNLLYDYLPPVSTLFAGTFNALTCRRVGRLLLYSFNLRVRNCDIPFLHYRLC